MLGDAVNKLIADEDHWAFTQKSQWFDKSGKPSGGITVERYDPSKPFESQWTLIQYFGHRPSSSDVHAWKKEKQRVIKHDGERSLGDVLDLDHATQYATTDAGVRYLVPIAKGASKRFPADKLELFMDVDKATHTLQGFSLRPKGTFRIAGIVKIEGGEVDGRLAVVQGNYAPALVWARGNGTGRILGLFRVGKGAEFSYCDYKRVRPYNERFDVKIGDVKALDF